MEFLQFKQLGPGCVPFQLKRLRLLCVYAGGFTGMLDQEKYAGLPPAYQPPPDSGKHLFAHQCRSESPRKMLN